MLKAHARLFKQVTLAADVLVIALCWLLAYWLRFYSGAIPHSDIPPFSDYTLQLLPILVVWSVAFKGFDLYRPQRLGSHLSEGLDITKASRLAALSLVAIMSLVCPGDDYSC